MKVTLPDGKVIEYINDPLGRRIAKKVNGIITEKYLWQGLTRLLAVYDGADNLLERFIYADSRLPVAMISGGATYYLSYDQVGSLRSVSDVSGHLIKSLDYDSFGNIIQDTNQLFDMPLGFAGGLYDPDTGLVRFGFREFSPEIGRWTAKDPIFFLGGDVDLYGYCINDPINLIDPLGLQVPPSGHISVAELLMAGRITEALEIATGIGLPIASKITQLQNTLVNLINKYPISSGNCVQLAKKIADAFKTVGANPRILNITDRCFAKIFTTSDGTVFSIHGYHRAVLVGDKVFDALTGPEGMQLTQYLKMLEGFGIQPVF